MDRPASVSVIINTYNRASNLKTALTALQFVRYAPFEVIVVNGPSTDDTLDVVRGFPDVKLECCSETNLSLSRNIGLAAAAGDVVAFLDDDAIPEPYWLDRILAAYGPDISGVGGYLKDHTGVTFQCRVVACDRFGRAHFFDSDGSPGYRRILENGGYPSPTGANVTFRRLDILEIGGFDETFHYYLDETDVCLRLFDAGRKVVFAPNAEVHHKYAASHLRDVRRAPKRLFQPAKSKAYFVNRHARVAGDLAGVRRELRRYRRGLARDNAHLRSAGYVTHADEKRLNAEVAAGLEVGESLARRPSAQGFDPGVFREPPPFKSFAPRRASFDRLRICFVSRAFPPRREDGIGLWTKNIAEGLAALGHEITVVADAGEDSETIDFCNDVWVHRIKGGRVSAQESSYVPRLPANLADFAASARDAVARIHLARGLDVVSCPIWDLEGASIVEWGKLLTVTSLHTTAGIVAEQKPDWNNQSEFYTAYVAKVLEGERRLLRKTDHILANSQAILNEVRRTFPSCSDRLSRAVIVPHGVPDVGAMSSAGRRLSGALRVVFVGRLERRKGADILLRSLPELFARQPEVDVRFVGEDGIDEGEGDLRANFETEYSQAPWRSKVSFMGRVERAVLEGELQQADIVVAPSRFESFGLVYVEAMSAGKPCIALDTGAAREIFEHERTGYLVRDQEPTSLAAAIHYLAARPDLCQKIGEQAREAYLARFTDRAMAMAAEQFFSDIVSASRIARDTH